MMNERTFFIAPFFFSVKDNSLFNKTQNENIMPVFLSEGSSTPANLCVRSSSDGDAQPGRNQLYKHLRGWQNRHPSNNDLIEIQDFMRHLSWLSLVSSLSVVPVGDVPSVTTQVWRIFLVSKVIVPERSRKYFQRFS